MQRILPILLLFFLTACIQPHPTEADFDPADGTADVNPGLDAETDAISGDSDADTDVPGDARDAEDADVADVDAADVPDAPDIASEVDADVADLLEVADDVDTAIDAQTDFEVAPDVDAEDSAGIDAIGDADGTADGDGDSAGDDGADGDSVDGDSVDVADVDLCADNTCTNTACTTSTCNPSTGKCDSVNLPDTTTCTSTDKCVSTAACVSGVCSATAFVNCEDGNGCTTDSCLQTGCVHLPNSATCSDGNTCTQGDACAESTCSGKITPCADGNVCTDDGCNPVSGCTFIPNTAGCDDGAACTLMDVCSAGVCAGSPGLFEASYGGSGSEKSRGIVRTSDGGFALLAATTSDPTGAGAHFNLLHTDSLGKLLWNQTYDVGSSGTDLPAGLTATSDGGVVMVGTGSSPSGGVTHVIRTDGGGKVSWDKSFSKTGDSGGQAVIVSSDGFTFLGRTYFPSSGYEFWLLHLNQDGATTWDQTYGGQFDESPRGLVRTIDGGYALCGGTKSTGGTSPGDSDFWLVRTDSSGNLQWSQRYGSTADQIASGIVLLDDGGFVLAGTTESGGNTRDIWLVRTDLSGGKMWDRTFSKAGNDDVNAIIGVTGGGFLLTGSVNEATSLWFMRTDGLGNLAWERTISSSLSSSGVATVGNGGFAVVGTSHDVANSDNLTLLRTDFYGNSTCVTSGICEQNDWNTCDDLQPCTADLCDASHSGCWHASLTEQSACNDGLFCTVSDGCKGGSCVGLNTVGCNEPCVKDSQCAHGCNLAIGICFACSGDNDCAAGKYCVSHACSSAPPCSTDASCVGKKCDPVSQMCVECLQNSECPNSGPIPGYCYKSSCVGSKACLLGILNCPSGTYCNSIPNAPFGGGICGECATDQHCPIGNYCDGGTCRPRECSPNATGCVSGIGATCNAHGAQYTIDTCDDGNECTIDSCSPDSGCVHIAISQNPCGANACTNAGTCSGGACTGTTPVSCDDGTACTIDTCSLPGGCVHVDLLGEFTFGGAAIDQFSAIAVDDDGGTALGGRSNSGPAGGFDMWLVDFGTKGNKRLEQTFGGPGDESANGIFAVPGGGFVLAGTTTSKSASMDGWLVRADKFGNLLGESTFGGTGSDGFNAIAGLSDGFLVAGSTSSSGGGGSDAWLVRTDVLGKSMWEKTYGDSGSQTASQVTRAADGTFFLVGSNTTAAPGGMSGWLLHITADGISTGEQQWNGLYAGSLSAIAPASDGGYALAGVTNSNTGGSAMWLIRTNAQGVKVWEQTYGAGSLSGVVGLTGGGFALTGNATSSNGLWIAGTDAAGVRQWERTFSSGMGESGAAIAILGTNSLAVAGVTSGKGAGQSDGYLVSTDLSGNSTCSNSGTCYGKKTGDCSDGLACTSDRCDSTHGGCWHSNFDDGTPCSDGDFCTTGDICQGGSCVSGSKSVGCGAPCSSDAECGGLKCGNLHACVECAANADCPSGLCYVGKCYVANSCSKDADCPVGNCTNGFCKACNTSSECGGLTCFNHACITPISCSGDSDCGAQHCLLPKNACVDCTFSYHCGVGQYCDNSFHCAPKLCVNSGCSGGSFYDCPSSGNLYTATKCDDGNSCTTDTCSDSAGCSHVNAENKATCGIGGTCVTSQCDGNGVCLSTVTVCPGGGTCDPASNSCKGGTTAQVGSCLPGDSSCMSTCIQQKCPGAPSFCDDSDGCKKFLTCIGDCGSDPPIIPSQSTPIARYLGESDRDYCGRVCAVGLSPDDVNKFSYLQGCEFGQCMSPSGAVPTFKTQLQSLCGEQTFCASPRSKCLNDSECGKIFVCAFTCATQDCVNACTSGVPATAENLYFAYTLCVDVNAVSCVTP